MCLWFVALKELSTLLVKFSHDKHGHLGTTPCFISCWLVQKPKLDRFGSSPGDEDDVDTSADLSFLPGQLMIHGLLTVED